MISGWDSFAELTFTVNHSNNYLSRNNMKKQMTILKIALLGVMIFGGMKAHAQVPAYEWAGQIGGDFTEAPKAIQVDNSGNIYITGRFNGTVDFDPSVSTVALTATAYSIFFCKYSPSGALIWAKDIASSGLAEGTRIEIDATGNVYLTGFVPAGVSDFDPSAATVNLTSAGQNDIFLAKYDSNGNYLWAHLFGSTGDDKGHAIHLDNSSNIYLGGEFAGSMDIDPSASSTILTSSGYQDGFLAKYDSNGNAIWAFKLGNSANSETVYRMKTDSNGDIVISGNYTGTTDFDPSAAVANLAGNTAMFWNTYFAKYTSSGQYIMAKGLLCDISTDAGDLVLDASNNIYLAGNINGTVDFDPSPAVLSKSSTGGAGNGNMYTAKYSPAGNLTWVIQASGNGNHMATGVSIDGNGIIVNGYFSGVVDFDPSAVTATLTPAGSSSGFLAKYDQNGNYVWAQKLGGTSFNSNMTDNTVKNGKLTVLGSFGGTADFDFSSSVSNMTAINNDAMFIVKYAICTPTISTLNQTACTSYTLNGTIYNASGTYTQLLQNTAGCDSTITLNLTIGDVTAPIATIASLPAITGQCSVTSLTAPTATDNCSGTITGTHNAILPITTQGTTTVTWTYNDGHGNTSTQTQNVIITDNISPVANSVSLASITGQCSVTSLTAPTATDNCAGTITGTHNALLPITTQGTTVVTWTYNDGHGNTSTQTQNVIITDNISPVADLPTLQAVAGQCSVTSLVAPTATDNCAGTITGTHNAILPITTQGTTSVTWTYSDGNGNTSTQTQNVVVTDNTAPVASLANLPAVTGNCSVASLTAPTATDNCAGTITGTHNATLPINAPGTTVVTWTYSDGHGNTSTQTQNVVITAPSATITVSGLTITATTSGATYQWINCGTGNSPIAGATSQAFTATANGTYAVTVIQNGCSETSDCVTISIVGMNEHMLSGIILFPNPTAGIVTLEVENELTDATIRLISMTGQLIGEWNDVNGKSFSIDLSQHMTGMYFIEVNEAENTFRIKVNKQ